MGNLTRNFGTHEFACRCECDTGTIAQDLVEVLQEVRDHFGKPMTITSGIRCETHNAKIGGAQSSKHITGMASDFKVKDTEPEVVYRWLDERYPDTYGLGLYNSWVHLDVRKGRARWDNHG